MTTIFKDPQGNVITEQQKNNVDDFNELTYVDNELKEERLYWGKKSC